MKSDPRETQELRRAASRMGKARMAGMSTEARSDLARLARNAHWSPPTKRDKRIAGSVKASFSKAIHEAVDTLFYEFAKGGSARVLVIHQGDARLMEPGSKDCLIQQRKFPDSIIGTYDRRATRSDVLDDIAENHQRLWGV